MRCTSLVYRRVSLARQRRYNLYIIVGTGYGCA